MSKDTGGPAFPRSESLQYSQHITGGMTLRQYAAIKLKVPNSGTDWLDEMIKEAKRDCFAAKALPPMMHADIGRWEGNYQIHAERAYKYADEMLRAREEK